MFIAVDNLIFLISYCPGDKAMMIIFSGFVILQPGARCRTVFAIFYMCAYNCYQILKVGNRFLSTDSKQEGKGGKSS